MTKVRVYELAKEFEMESKVLTAELISLGYDVKAYNSSLEEDVAAKVREHFSAGEPKKVKVTVKKTKKSEEDIADLSVSATEAETTEVEDKRIQTKGKTTIIRRRRKKVKVDVPEEVIEDAEDEILQLEVQPEANKKSEIVEEPVAEVAEEPSDDAAKEKEMVDDEQPDAEIDTPLEEDLDETDLEDEKQDDVEGESEDAGSVEAIEKEKVPKKKVAKPSRKGLAKIIKKSAIEIPVEVKRSRPGPKKHPKPKGKSPASGGGSRKQAGADQGKSGKVSGGPSGGRKFAGNDRADASGGVRPAGKGKKGKRFVKFTHEPGAKNRKGGKRKGYAEVDMEDVAMAGGRFSASLKIGRGGRGGKKVKQDAPADAAETKAIKKRIKIHDVITIGDFAHRMGVKASEVIGKLMGLGVMATVNQSLDIDTATIVAPDFGYEVEKAMTEEVVIENLEDQESGGEMVLRPPVVTVMGHVDHGKTSILDAIRSTDVAEGEAGGITQHIGAHFVRSAQGDIVFLDTPGHAAFTEMRSRGAKVTDVVVLVVAADDGVMDQTKEAINHAKAAEVPIVVAVNKIDKDDADPMRVKRELAEYDLNPEEWGGDTIFCETSAKQKLGIDELLEQILLQAEILELKADKQRKARGRVVEAKLHKGRGPVATILVQQGTLRPGDAFVVGNFYGKVRSLLNDKGAKINEAEPAWPVEVQGLNGVPKAGDEFVVVNDERMAKKVASERKMKSRESQLGLTSKVSLDNLFEKLQEGDVKELKVLLRSDVQGTLEAFGKSIEKLSTDTIKVKIIHEGTGAIIDSDVLLAAASDAIIIGFNVRPSTKVQDFAAKESVDVRYYDVIYHALDDIRNAMVGLLDPVFEEEVIGSLEVRDTFNVPKIGTIAGCHVDDGKIERSAEVRLVRDGVVVYSGKIISLRRFKDDVKEVASGYECGVGLENFNDIKVSDVLEIFVMNEVAAKL